MFRIRDPQESLWQSQFLVTPKKAKRLERSWAEVFRNEALPLIDEERFAPMYCVDNGRPNRAVQTVLGVHLLKEMFNLTDDEALEQLEFNLLWQLQADGPCTPGGDGEHGSAGGRDGTCGRGRMRAPLHNFHRVP